MSKSADIDSGRCLHLKPDPPSFGCICKGGMYRLRIILTNHNNGGETERLRVSCLPIDNNGVENTLFINCFLKQVAIANGLSTTLELELNATDQGHFKFSLTIYQSSGINTVRSLDAYIIPAANFHPLKRALLLENRNIYEDGVKLAMRKTASESGSLASGLSEISVALFDEEDLDDLVELPFMDYMYYDPFKKILISDPLLMQIEFHPDWNKAEFIHHNELSWTDRMRELEDKFMITHRAAIRLLEQSNRKFEFTSLLPLPKPLLPLPVPLPVPESSSLNDTLGQLRDFRSALGDKSTSSVMSARASKTSNKTAKGSTMSVSDNLERQSKSFRPSSAALSRQASVRKISGGIAPDTDRNSKINNKASTGPKLPSVVSTDERASRTGNLPITRKNSFSKKSFN